MNTLFLNLVYSKKANIKRVALRMCTKNINFLITLFLQTIKDKINNDNGF